MNRPKTVDDVHQLISASTASAALGAAIETGLLWLLNEKPMSGDEVSASLGIPCKRCHYWLQFLTNLGILHTAGGRFSPSALACAAILESRSQVAWRQLVMDERERAAGVHNLALYLGEPGSVWKAQGLAAPRDYVEKMKGDLERARDFARTLYELHGYLGNELAALLDLEGASRLMDLGGGSGVISMALLRRYPGLTATVIDIENVCIAGAELAEENALAGRLAFHPADLLKDDLPGGFDEILMCDVGSFSTELFHKLSGCLNESGGIIIVNHFSPEDNVLPVSRLRWSFLDSLENPEFSISTISQAEDMIRQAGFTVLPRKAALSDKRVVIQAIK